MSTISHIVLKQDDKDTNVKIGDDESEDCSEFTLTSKIKDDDLDH